jgi:hypothetical protein
MCALSSRSLGRYMPFWYASVSRLRFSNCWSYEESLLPGLLLRCCNPAGSHYRSDDSFACSHQQSNRAMGCQSFAIRLDRAAPPLGSVSSHASAPALRRTRSADFIGTAKRINVFSTARSSAPFVLAAFHVRQSCCTDRTCFGSCVR